MKEKCAIEANKLIKNGMIVGLGGGRTIAILVKKIKGDNKNIKVITPSTETKKICIENNIEIIPMEYVKSIDIAFDGCNEIDEKLNCLKSDGGIHTKEKIAGKLAKEYIILADEDKWVKKLTFEKPVTLEVIPEALSYVENTVKEMGASVETRKSSKKAGYVLSDNSNYLVDSYFKNIKDVEELEKKLKLITGIVETSLFCGVVDKVIVATEKNVKTFERK